MLILKKLLVENDGGDLHFISNDLTFQIDSHNVSDLSRDVQRFCFL